MQKINRTKDNSEQKRNENKREPGTKEELLKVQKRTFTKSTTFMSMFRRGPFPKTDRQKEEEELLSI